MKFLGRSGDKGVVLLQAMILVFMMTITAMGVVAMALGGFLGSTKVEVSQAKKGNADQAHSLLHADLVCLDPDMDGVFDDVACPPVNQSCAAGWGSGAMPKSCDYVIDGQSVTASLTYAGGQYTISIGVP